MLQFSSFVSKGSFGSLSPTRQTKQTSRAASNDETLANIDDDKRKQSHLTNFREPVEKQLLKQREEFDNQLRLSRRHQGNETFAHLDRRTNLLPSSDADGRSPIGPNATRYFHKAGQRPSEKIPKRKTVQHRSDDRPSFENNFPNAPRHQYEYRERKFIINHPNRNIIRDRYGSGQSSSTVSRSTVNHRLPTGPQLDSLHVYPTNERRSR